METITFILTLPEGAKSPIVLAAGGADGDQNGMIETESEVAAFVRKEPKIWVREQSVQSPTTNMLFAVTFTIGSGALWILEVKNAAGASLYRGASKTVFSTETVSFFL